jgi:hypothetical protein
MHQPRQKASVHPSEREHRLLRFNEGFEHEESSLPAPDDEKIGNEVHKRQSQMQHVVEKNDVPQNHLRAHAAGTHIQSNETQSEELHNTDNRLNRIYSPAGNPDNAANTQRFQENMEKEVKNVDGEQLLNEAAQNLPTLDNEVYEAGLKGPPPVEKKPLGLALFKAAISLRELGPQLKKDVPAAMHFIVDKSMKQMTSTAFTLRVWVRGSIEDIEGVTQKPRARTAEDEAFSKDLESKFMNAMKPEEKTALKDFSDNMERYLQKEKATGRTFLSDQERKNAANGRGYVVEWAAARILHDVGTYKELEKMSKDPSMPVSIGFEESKDPNSPSPTLVFTPKNGKQQQECKDYADGAAKAIGRQFAVSGPGNTLVLTNVTIDQLVKLEEFLKKEQKPVI